MRHLELSPLARQQLLARLAAMPELLQARLGALGAAEAAAPGPNASFSPVEHAWHLADLEREGYLARIGCLLSEDEPLLPDFEGDRIARERSYKTRSLAAGLTAFEQARAETLARLAGLAEAEWLRAGRQEGVGRVALCDLPAMIEAHDASHRAELAAWLEARGGPAGAFSL
jgi:DinB superfamily